MAVQKKSGQSNSELASRVTAVLLMGLAVGMLVLLGVGLLVSALMARGSVPVEWMERSALGALFFGALAGGWFACCKMRTKPLVWGLCTAAAIAITSLVIGALAYGIQSPRAALIRLAAALFGGVCAGVLSALAKK